MTEQHFPKGWDAKRVDQLARHYDELSEDDQAAEDEAAATGTEEQTVVTVPTALIPAIRELLAAHHGNSH